MSLESSRSNNIILNVEYRFKNNILLMILNSSKSKPSQFQTSEINYYNISS